MGMGRKVEVKRSGSSVEVSIESRLGRLKVVKGQGEPLYYCSGVFDEPRPDDVPEGVLRWLKSKGYEPIVLGRAMFTPSILAVKGDDVIACDFERRSFELEEHETIRVPLRRFGAKRLAVVPLRYYFSQSSSGRVYVTEVERILRCLLSGKTVIDEQGRMFIEVPFEEWHPVIGKEEKEDDVTKMLKRIEKLLKERGDEA